MKREHFVEVVEEVLDSLPQEFRSRIRNVAVLVEDMPPNQPSPQSITPQSISQVSGQAFFCYFVRQFGKKKYHFVANRTRHLCLQLRHLLRT